MDERRAEPRIPVNGQVTMTPLAAVATRLRGTVVNVSGRGLQVLLEDALRPIPRNGDVYRIECGDDLMLCEVRRGEVNDAGTELGFQILHWAKVGELNRLLKEFNSARSQKHSA